ncbi:hypothetical protein I6A84_33475 [Frankia sp. CNm7]|uniref:Peptide chain release factor 1 n=2 Tax=Frankia nepalensis TaxID=1836974 RepID=A0A937UPY9_9ACTN|nr:hypothetical protein [Frankia nepalensis]MBL7514095.1 hypothetical protein [Frankia nepalensis]MBL7522867.1 hypothetical protein [Frankia nepalensis]MBL7629563.1 hypothetical protein [Frankia nepalensis]
MDVGRLFATTGPFATLYLGLTDQLAEIEPRRALRWRRLRDQLDAAGAAPADLCALDDAVIAVGPENTAFAAFAADGRVVWSRRLPSDLDDRAVWGPLPCVLPLLAYEQSIVPHLVVLTDRTGADLRADIDGVRILAQVEGSDDEIERNAPGGWSQRRFQDRAEDSWAHNAGKVAEAVTALTEQVNAALVAVAGDVRAVQLLREQLPARVAPLVRQLDHGARHPSRGDRLRDQEIHDLVDAEARTSGDALLARFVEDRAHGLAADGARATVEALTRSAAQTLLVVDDPGDDRVAWFGPEAAHLATDPGTLAGLVTSPTAGRLADVAARAALGTGAGVHVLPPGAANGPAEGLGALLRYPAASG